LRYKAEESIEALPTLQLSILSTSARYLKVGGELVYSTCTLNPEENEGVFDKFLADNPEYEAVEFSVGGYSSLGGKLTLLPHIHNTDGFFMAKLVRRS